MKRLNRCHIAIVLSAFFAALLPALAADDYVHLYGSPAPETAATRSIVISPDTRYVNVEGGEIILFAINGSSFAWHFNAARTVGAFDLNAVAPPNALKHTVRAYVSPDPHYLTAP